ncbi:MAG TPA: hypothetical protein VLL52_21550 [Anaerolineae bacterium]|nr:hypothetical protein [Anaerolineae bacterium]
MTTYTWNNGHELLTTTVDGVVTRIYSYTQAGHLDTAIVNGLTTTFAYNGDGLRLRMTVGSSSTIYVHDYGGNGRILYEEGGLYATSKHYLYGGSQCIAELINADDTDAQWQYYHRDGNGLVRHTTSSTGTLLLSWTYSPEGLVLEGEENLITNLDCGMGGVYDWSTGLIYGFV